MVGRRFVVLCGQQQHLFTGPVTPRFSSDVHQQQDCLVNPITAHTHRITNRCFLPKPSCKLFHDYNLFVSNPAAYSHQILFDRSLKSLIVYLLDGCHDNVLH